ncbi:MAG: hypothetical protein JXR58_01100 [Bacteroidales bacterium]|nr:hypothetical protein [Bacteroidales bacterium]
MKAKYLLASLILVSSFLITSCGIFGKFTKSKWSKVEREAFMSTCVEGLAGTPDIDAEDYCNCMLEKLEDKFPNAIEAQNIDELQLQEWAVDCLQDDGKKKKKK